MPVAGSVAGGVVRPVPWRGKSLAENGGAWPGVPGPTGAFGNGGLAETKR